MLHNLSGNLEEKLFFQFKNKPFILFQLTILNLIVVTFVAESLFLGGVALSGQTLAVVVGSIAGAIICLTLVVAAGLCVKYRRYRALRDKARQSPSLGHLTGTQRSQGKGNI